MCASARNVTIPTPPHPNPTPSHDLRSTDHVCKCKERYHPHPTPPQPHPNFIYINPLGAGVPGERQAPRVYIYIYISTFASFLLVPAPCRTPPPQDWRPNPIIFHNSGCFFQTPFINTCKIFIIERSKTRLLPTIYWTCWRYYLRRAPGQKVGKKYKK